MMSTFASCPSDPPRLVPGLRLRPVAELETCLVYRQRPPALMMLNLSAWLLVEILNEQPNVDPWPAFRDAVRHASALDQAREMMERALSQLADFGLIEQGITMPKGEGQ